MDKLMMFAGLVLASYLMLQINNDEIGTNDILQVMSVPEVQVDEVKGYHLVESYVAKYYENAFKRVSKLDEFERDLRGAILPVEIENGQKMARFFLSLKGRQDVETVVVLAENSGQLGARNILSSAYGFETVLGKIQPDLDFIKELKVDLSVEVFQNESAIDKFVPYLQEAFPEVKIVPVVIKDEASEEELRRFAESLNEAADDETVVLAVTDFGQSGFREELRRNVVESFDVAQVGQLDVSSAAALKALFYYLDLQGARLGVNEQIVKFFEGDEISEDRELTILAFGDLMLGRHVATLMKQKGEDYIFEKIAGEDGRFFKGADVVHGNLEGPIKGEGRSGGTAMIFSFNETVAPLLKRYGFNLMSLANNHATDQGWDGRDTTIAALDGADLGWCGHPSEADPGSVYYGTVKEKKFAFVCLHDVTYKLDDAKAVELIRQVKAEVDYLIVSIHWGYEYKHKPDMNVQVLPARAFIDAGADFVIGHHPHVVQSFEIYKGRPIFYSLGNFVFDQYWSRAVQEELALGIVLDDAGEGENFSAKIYLFPMKSVNSQSRLMDESEKALWFETFISYGEYDEATKAMIRNGMIELGDE